MMMIFRGFLFLAAAFSVGCAPQLPSRTDVELNRRPQLQGTYMALNPEIGANNLANYVGRLCRPDAQGNCKPIAGRYLRQGTEVRLQPALPAASPAYRSLVNSSFSASGNFPFVKPAADAESLNEVEVRTVATAVVPPENFPGFNQLLAELRRNDPAAAASGETLYWTEGASIMVVQQRAFRRVNSSAGVAATGFGFDGKTFSNSEGSSLVPFIGLELREVRLRAGPPAVIGTSPGLAGAPTPMPTRGIGGRVTRSVLPVDDAGNTLVPLAAWRR
jgi:hypothetical protein